MTTENPIMEYLHTILERTDQLVEDVTDLRHRMAKLERFILEQKQKMPVRTSSKDSKDEPKQLVKKINALSKDPERLKRVAKCLDIGEESLRLRIQRLADAIEESQGETVTKLNVAEAQMMCCIE
jgi:chromosome segregation ATPase